ncbi:Ig-like domain-containing protein [Pseudidiomarina marina]|uniref:Ig-like domain-containing protein n=1 Tax=Pseudidiomarina marina TaxID=502366 RepID=UPI0038517304
MNKPTKLALSLVCVGVLSACGSDGKEEPPVVIEEPAAYLLSGTVTGLNGELSVTAGEEEVTVTEDGAIAFATEFNSGDTVTASITAAPELQECAITSDTEFTFEDTDIDALVVECRDLELYVAVDDTAETADDAAVTIDVFANDTSEYAETFELLDVTEPANGTAAIAENKITYTPNAGFAGTDTFSYTATDGAQEASAEVTVTVSQTVGISGRAVDSPIANAIITITIGETTYTTEADADGYFDLDLNLLNSADDTVLEIIATGVGEQDYVTLSSRLSTVADLLELAGEDRVLSAEESSDVVVTHVTTAMNQQLEVLAAGESITSANIQELMMQVDGQLVLEMAALIKLLVDDENYSLPEGFTSIEDFLNDSDAYNTLLNETNISGDLQAMVAATLADSDVMPAIDPVQQAGNFILLRDYHRYNANQNSVSYSIDSDGSLYQPSYYDEEVTYIPFVDGKWIGNSGESTVDMQGSMFIQYYGYLYDAEHFDKFVLSLGENPSDVYVTFTSRYYLEATPINLTQSSMTLHSYSDGFIEPIQFEYGGEQLELPEVKSGRGESVYTYLRPETLITGLTFDLSEEKEFVYYSEYNTNNGLTLEDEPNALYFFSSMAFTFSPNSELSGTFTRDVLEGGSYELSSDKTILTLNYSDERMNYSKEDLYLLNNEAHAEIVLSKRYLDNGEVDWSTHHMPQFEEGINTAEVVNDQVLWQYLDSDGKLEPLIDIVGARATEYRSDGSIYYHNVVCDEVGPSGDKWSDCVTVKAVPNIESNGPWEAYDNTSILVFKSCNGDVCGGSFRRVTSKYDDGVMVLLSTSKYPPGTLFSEDLSPPDQVHFYAAYFTLVKASPDGLEPEQVAATSLIRTPADDYQQVLPWMPAMQKPLKMAPQVIKK